MLLERFTRKLRYVKLTTGGTDLDVESVDAKLLATSSNILSSQHGSVGGGLVTVGLDLHATGDTSDGFAATGITQNVSLQFRAYRIIPFFLIFILLLLSFYILPGAVYA